MPRHAQRVHPGGRLAVSFDHDLDPLIEAAHLRRGGPLNGTINYLVRLGLQKLEDDEKRLVFRKVSLT